MKAFCLCLDERLDHWLELEKQVNNSGLEFESFVAGDGITFPLERYDYVDDPNPDVSRWGYGKPEHKKNHYNAFMAHKEIIRRAKAQGLKQFLMLEDDAYLTDRFEHVIRSVVSTCWHPDWNREDNALFDLLYLGWWIGDEYDDWNVTVEEEYKKNKNVELQKAWQIGGLHGVIINQSMYDTILSMPPINPIDWQINRMHSKIQSYFVKPKAIGIKSTWSFCEGRYVERKSI